MRCVIRCTALLLTCALAACGVSRGSDLRRSPGAHAATPQSLPAPTPARAAAGSPVGTWVVDYRGMPGAKTAAEQAENLKMAENTISMEIRLQADGTFTTDVKIVGSTLHEAGTWRQEGSRVVLSPMDAKEKRLELRGEGLVAIDQQGEEAFWLKRQ